MANKTEIVVNRQTVVNSVEVREGNKVFKLSRGRNGVVLSLGKNSINIPNGAIGSHLTNELNAMLDGSNSGGDTMVVKPKRHRRTKAEMDAARASSGSGEGENSPEPEA